MAFRGFHCDEVKMIKESSEEFNADCLSPERPDDAHRERWGSTMLQCTECMLSLKGHVVVCEGQICYSCAVRQFFIRSKTCFLFERETVET